MFCNRMIRNRVKSMTKQREELNLYLEREIKGGGGVPN